MPRVFWFALAAGVLVWVSAFMDVGGKPHQAVPEVPATDPEPESASVATEARAQPAAPTTRTAPAATTMRMPAGPPQPGNAMLQQATTAMRSMRGQPGMVGPPAANYTVPGSPSGEPQDEATGELGEGVLSPEYAAFERAYAYEPRDGAWAAAEENNVRGMLAKSPVGKLSTIVNCQQTICRVVLENAPKDAFDQLVQVPGLLQATGLVTNSPYSYRSGQLSVYFQRRSAIPPSASP